MAATQVNVHEAKTHFSKLLERVAQGEEIIIARNGEPVARLVQEKPRLKKRVAGGLKGVRWAEDFPFDYQYSEEEKRAFCMDDDEDEGEDEDEEAGVVHGRR